jgi:hypothetical protein
VISKCRYSIDSNSFVSRSGGEETLGRNRLAQEETIAPNGNHSGQDVRCLPLDRHRAILGGEETTKEKECGTETRVGLRRRTAPSLPLSSLLVPKRLSLARAHRRPRS